ncbi:MAG: DUF86 domain-containing protein [bacterium]|nr:DUF86 domain-containing protein [bacterium]
MVDTEVVTVKLAELIDRLERIRSRCPEDAEALAADRDAFEVVSFNLILAVQICLDIASHLIADEGWSPAKTLGESFLRLGEHAVIGEETAKALQPAAGMRNILAHVYSSVDPGKVHRAATAGLADLERFAREVSAWTVERT